MVETHPFKPFVPKNSRYLFLGTFTGKIIDNSYDWYFGTKRNQFWKIMEGVYKLKLYTKNDKEALFLKIKLAITDTIYQCERDKGNNSDGNLINIVYNFRAIKEILKENKIEKIYFSSRLAEKIFKKNFKNIIEKYPIIELITLPSPSPRYAALSLNEKIKRYKNLLPSYR